MALQNLTPETCSYHHKRMYICDVRECTHTFGVSWIICWFHCIFQHHLTLHTNREFNQRIKWKCVLKIFVVWCVCIWSYQAKMIHDALLCIQCVKLYEFHGNIQWMMVLVTLFSSHSCFSLCLCVCVCMFAKYVLQCVSKQTRQQTNTRIHYRLDMGI